ncbi:hypothetical protein H5410_045773 [Solanum commersonii]|uniref:Uncharacterized protein n=1 Tax=Solanum commersonii TaxID=4109 RepID=A0A9J5XAH4_SOLCO|nr:hypothetical protein H5410_045773 [Solanum commersonii]
MLESAKDPSGTASLPYGLLISCILLDHLVNLSSFKPLEIITTYDTYTFSTMGLEKLLSTTERLVCLNKDTSTDVGKLHLAMSRLKHDGISTVHKVMKQVDSIKSGVSSSNTDLVVTFQNSYSSFSKNIERSYNTFCRNMLNTLKHFFGDR